MKIKVQTRKLAAGCSKHCFKVVDGTDEVSSKHCFEVVDRTDEVSNHIYGKVKLTWFEEIFEEYKSLHNKTHITVFELTSSVPSTTLKQCFEQLRLTPSLHFDFH
ncbi:hypothetical protein [Streptococcus pneumoniae]|uniref:hypothetical protein n=1 Tax=Streptococcus pneumoniae TaxID=1313 RepID=UPI001CCE53BD|nr:hypothetical protein [Streptococcus pneumoniae]